MLERLESRRLFNGASMVKDINTGEGLFPGYYTWGAAGDHAFVGGDDGVVGWELWKTDGTPQGTVLVKDIRPGRDNSRVGWITHAGDGSVFFTAENGTHGYELWKSDGTEAGTYMVRDINPGAAASNPANLVNVNGTLYFSASDGTNGIELWMSDGTEAGTVMVKNIAAGSAGSSPTQLINNNGTLFFRANNVTSGFELWTSNGTDGGTVMVKEIYNDNNSGVSAVPMAALNGFVYFSGISSTGGNELWRSDGTSGGTAVVKEIAATSSSSSPNNIKASGNLIYFTVSGGPTPGLYRTDGTDLGTFRLADTPLASGDAGGTFVFAQGTTLFGTDGVNVETLKTGLTATTVSAGVWTTVNGTLYFPAADAATNTGEELWKTDGTAGGTALVKDFEPGPGRSRPVAIMPLGVNGAGGVIVGTYDGSAFGGALYKTDGTDAGTSLVKDIGPGTGDNGIPFFTEHGGWMYFVGTNPAHSASGGGELYRSDGTEAGTSLVVDLNPGTVGANISALASFGGHLYFAADDGSGIGKELWRTNGTDAGTTLVKDINPGTPSSNWVNGVVAGNYLYFRATTAIQNTELWRTDGTDAGTIRLTDINPNAGNSQISNMTAVGGILYFTAFSGTSTFAGLFKSDGNSITQVASGSVFSAVSSLIHVNGVLYIAGTTSGTGSTGAELWKIASNGMAPVLVKDIAPGTSSSSPANFTNVDGTLFFTATTNGVGAELWKSDGTAAGTVLVKDIRPGSSGAEIGSMVATNGVAYFRADDGTTGNELWRSDGTAAGTYLLKDILAPGLTAIANNLPNRLYAANGYVYFAADDVTHGLEAWRSDGTPEGTAMLGDYGPEGTYVLYPSNVVFFTALGGEVFYMFTDDTHGSEPWKAHQADFATLGGAGGNVLTIRGTGGNDAVEISADGFGGVQVTLNGLTEHFMAGTVASLVVHGLTGRDTIDVAHGTVTFSADLGATATNLTLRVADGATARFDSTQHLAGLEFGASGVAALTPGGGKALVFASTPVIETGGKLDLNDNDLVVDYSGVSPIGVWTGSAYDGLAGMIADGRIVSSMSSGTLKTLGVAEAGEAFDLEPGQTASFAGQTVDASAALIKYTWGGDANLDGKLNVLDYGQIDFNIGQSTPARAWLWGDFNFDGKINILDYGVIDFNVVAQDQVL